MEKKDWETVANQTKCGVESWIQNQKNLVKSGIIVIFIF